jgi:hypothetical protein
MLREGETVAELRDEAHGAAWWLFWFPDLTLDLRPGSRAGLRAAMEHHARFMFEDSHRRVERPSGTPLQAPRTADRSWTPMVELDDLALAAGAGLRVLHRMHYEPGHETLLGHILVPTNWGLFEARVVTPTRGATGLRESVLHLQRPIDAPRLSQPEMDDPAHDLHFPDHPLSRARAALARFVAEAQVRVAGPSFAWTDGEVALERLGCALVTPPRFVLDRVPPDETHASFKRVSFCGTDGVERFRVEQAAVLRDPAALRQMATTRMRVGHAEAGVEDITVAATDERGPGDRAEVQIIVEGRGDQGQLRSASRWFRDEKGHVWSVSLFGTAAVPAESLVGELRAAAASWRSLAPEPSNKPSWWARLRGR